MPGGEHADDNGPLRAQGAYYPRKSTAGRSDRQLFANGMKMNARRAGGLQERDEERLGIPARLSRADCIIRAGACPI